MENLEKKQKLEADKMDPFENLEDDVHSMILQHFSGIDVMVSSEVSQKWYEKIGSSKLAMSKIALNTYNPDAVIPVKVFKSSQRKYSSIFIKCPSFVGITIQEKLLKEFAPSLTHVKLGLISKMFDLPTQDFPMLRALEMDGLSRENTKKFFVYFANNKLEKLALINCTIPTEVIIYMQSHNQIKELTFLGSVFPGEQDISYLENYNFVKLRLAFERSNEILTTNITHLVHTQARSLMYFGRISTPEVFAEIMVMQLPALSCIEMTGYFVLPALTPPNHNVEAVKITRWIKFPPTQKFFADFPNLRKIQVKGLRSSDMSRLRDFPP